MDPQDCGQDIVRCTLCKDAVAPMYSEVCHIDLCKDCVVEHLSDTNGFHKVVSLKQFLTTLKYNSLCPNHPTKQCKNLCEECNVPLCSLCVSSGEHDKHKIEDILYILFTKKNIMQKDVQELEESIYTKHQEAASNIPFLKAGVRKHSQQLRTALNKQRQAMHTEIDTIVQRMTKEIDDMDAQHMGAIEKQEDALNKTIKEIKQVILKSRIKEFRKLPDKLRISLPNFLPHKINTKQLLHQFGSLSPLFIETEEQSYTAPSQGTEYSSSDRQLLDVPRLITDIPTGHTEVTSVSCLSDEEIWTLGDSGFLMLYNLEGKLLKSVKPASYPKDIEVTKTGDLVYCDPCSRSINIVRGTQTKTLITLLVWQPLYICSASSGDLLVTMISDKNQAIKVVRYSGYVEKQSIQWDDQGKPLYTPHEIKDLSENRNLDICVADFSAGAVVVVNAAGNLRFRYTGPPSESLIRAVSITTDSQANILTVDWNSNVHIIDQDGHLLRFYVIRRLFDCPFGLSADTRDNLFVTEECTGVLKKIQIYKRTD